MEFKTLVNGLQIVYEKPSSSLPISSICVACKNGSSSEPFHLKGISHLIEHLCFKGTHRVPDTKTFLEEFSILGVEHNAYTRPEAVLFLIKCQDHHLEKCIKLLSESILTSKFSESNFKKEINVISEENRKDEDDPQFVISTATTEIVFEHTPFQFPVDHSSFHTTTFNYNDVYNYYKETYIPSNLIFSVTTNKPFGSVLNWVNKSVFAKSSVLSKQMKITPQQSGFDYKIIKKKNMKNVFLNISFRTCTYYDTDRVILNLLIFTLGNGINGRLVDTLRQKYGLVYYINASTGYNFSGGVFTISTQCDEESLLDKNPSVLSLIIKELKLLLKGISQKELTLTKNNKKEGLLFALEDVYTLSLYNEESLIYYSPSEIVPYSKLYEIIDKITLQEVNNCIKKYFKFDDMCLTILGSKLPPENDILEECLKLY